MNKMIPLLLLAALTSACANNETMKSSDTMMKEESMNGSMQKMDDGDTAMKQDGAMDSMSHDSMMSNGMSNDGMKKDGM